MKKLLALVAVLVVLAGAAVFILPSLVPMERIEREISTRFTAATGRTLSYSAASVTFWPNVGLRLADVKISNPAWAKSDTMLAMQEMDISLSALALLEKRVDIKTFILNKPVIALETAADGRTSWTLTPQGAGQTEKTTPSTSSEGAAQVAMPVTLGDIRITDGEVSLRDGKTGKVDTISDLDLTVVMQDLASPLSVDGAMTFRGQRVNVKVALDHPMDLVAGKSSPGSLTVAADLLSAEVAGTLATTGTLLKGRVNAKISSLPALAAWLGGGEEGSLPVKTVSLDSTTEITASTLSFNGATVALDDMRGSGNLRVKTDGVRPSVFARLTLDHVNLDRFIAGDADAASAEKAAPLAGTSGWDDTPIDFSGLRAIDADVVVEAKGFTVKGVEVGPSTLTTRLAGGKLEFSTSEAAVFDGTVKAAVSVNAVSATPMIAAKAALTGVQAKPLLSSFAGFDKLSGTTEGALDITTSGTSQRALISALAGNGKLVFRNGAIEGIDAVRLAKMIQSKLGEMGVGGGKTDFVEMGGTFTIAGGVVSNSDLSLRGPLVQATGKGTVSLPTKSLRYRVEPVLTASSAVDNATGIRVPVDIVGPFSDIKIRPDYAAVLQDALKDPEKLKATLKQAEDSLDPLKDNIKTLRKDFKDDPAKAIGGLLGGGVGGLLAPKATAPATTAPVVPEAAPTPTPIPAESPVVAPEQQNDAPQDAPIDPSNPAATDPAAVQ